VDEIVKRTVDGGIPMWKVLENYHRQKDGWNKAKTICILRGLAGCGKTTYLLHYFKDKKTFYFSFNGLEEALAEKLFAKQVTDKTGITVSGWEEAIQTVSAKYRVVLLDDITSISSYKRFQKAFYDHMISNIKTRPFVVLIAQILDDVRGLADVYDEARLGYFSVPEVMKLYPELSKHDILALCTISGGIPWIMQELDAALNIEDNLRKMLEPSSMFIRFVPELFSRYFQKPDNYHRVLHAIANGNHSVSEIGKFTGFAYNKCDNYLIKLVFCGLVKVEKAESERGTKKTAYTLANSYVRLWYKYVFLNQTDIRIGDRPELVEAIIRSIIDKEVHAFHLERAFAYVNKRTYELWTSLEISKKIVRTPKAVKGRNFRYTFDAIEQNGDRAVFIKVFKDPAENCGRVEFEKLRKAAAMVSSYYDSRVFIFTKRRFSDYAVAEAAKDPTITLVEVDRLRR